MAARRSWFRGESPEGSGLGRAIKVRRVELGLERRDLAERAGISYPYLAEIENDTKPGSKRVLEAIAAALGLELHELLEQASRIEAQAPAVSAVAGRAVGLVAPPRRESPVDEGLSSGLVFERAYAPADEEAEAVVTSARSWSARDEGVGYLADEYEADEARRASGRRRAWGDVEERAVRAAQAHSRLSYADRDLELYLRKRFRDLLPEKDLDYLLALIDERVRLVVREELARHGIKPRY